MKLSLPAIYAITDRRVSGIDDHSAIVERLVSAGVRCIQVREKELPDGLLLSQVERAASAVRGTGATLLVNDRADIAKILGLGVHLGNEDLPADAARRLLTEGAIVGLSSHSADEAREAFRSPDVDYVAFGPIFASSTKPGRSARGLDELAHVASEKTHPLVAVGGISAETLDSVLDAGADSAAMVGALLSRGRIEENAREIFDRVRRRTRPGRVYLVGFMASGKTTVGRRIAERLGVPFLDLDREIERTSGETVRAIFERAGEPVFRERESAFLDGTAALPDAVIATGGGTYTFEENRRKIARLGRAVYLDVPLPILLRRLAGKTDRPLFRDAVQAAELFARRVSFYEMAPIPVSLNDSPVERSADLVLAALAQRPVLWNPL